MVAINDVIQICPEHHCLGGAFAVVTEVHGWGILAEVPIPRVGVAPVRLGKNEFRFVGKQGWEPAEPYEPYPGYYRELQEALEELERSDPEVRAARANYEATVKRILGAP